LVDVVWVMAVVGVGAVREPPLRDASGHTKILCKGLCIITICPILHARI
jgi:hypothetical protein